MASRRVGPRYTRHQKRDLRIASVLIAAAIGLVLAIGAIIVLTSPEHRVAEQPAIPSPLATPIPES